MNLFHTAMKVKSTRVLRTTAHATVIKSQLGCLLRKQIAMIIPTCHFLTALKHPSIRPCWSILSFKQSSPSTSLSRIITPTTPLLLPCSLHTFHSSPCVNCLQERQQRWQTLWPSPRWQRHRAHTAVIVCWLDQSENTWGPFFWTLATQLDRRDLTQGSRNKTFKRKDGRILAFKKKKKSSDPDLRIWIVIELSFVSYMQNINSIT